MFCMHISRISLNIIPFACSQVEGEPEAARAQAHGRAAVRVRVLRARVRRQERHEPTPAHPHRGAALPLRGVWQVLRQG
jgi:hypothetical protein